MTVTGSRRIDLVIIIAVVSLMLLLASQLRVYFQVTMVDVSVEQVAPDGKRATIETPAEFKRVGAGYWRGETLVTQLKPQINAYMNASKLAAGAPAGTRFEWSVRWSDDSLKLDHIDRIDWEAR